MVVVFVLNLLLVDGVVGVTVPSEWIIYMQMLVQKVETRYIINIYHKHRVLFKFVLIN